MFQFIFAPRLLRQQKHISWRMNEIAQVTSTITRQETKKQLSMSCDGEFIEFCVDCVHRVTDSPTLTIFGNTYKDITSIMKTRKTQ